MNIIKFNYRKQVAFVLFFLLSIPLAFVGQPRQLDDGSILLENFEDDSVGGFPAEWYDRNGNARLIDHKPNVVKNYHYQVVEEEGNKFLRYAGVDAKHINYPLVNKEGIDIFEQPILRWEARAHQLPENADVDEKNRNDAVMSVYVVFDFGRVLFKKVPKSIRYTWGTSHTRGTEFSKFFNNQKIIVIESGPDKLGRWVTFERNIVEDYRRLFGDDPPAQPIAILVLSDGDSTNSFVKCDYDNFSLLPISEASK